MTDTITWSNKESRVVLSPRQGGLVLSWRRGDEEQALPLNNFDGGLLRTLFAEERYPGAGFSTPHHVLAHEESSTGFRVRLRHFWNTTNVLLKACGWPEKVNPLYLQDLLLDKTIVYDARRSVFTIELAIVNLSDEAKIFTPWLHNALAGWPGDAFVITDGQREPFRVRHVYWGSHTVDAADTARLVLSRGDGQRHAVLGAAPDMLAGFAAHHPPALAHACAELRCRQVRLELGERWCANAFLALASDWETWATDAPCPLYVRRDRKRPEWDPETLVVLLADWAMPDEREAGLMVLSFLDKAPFSALSRFRAAHRFGGFHSQKETAGAAAHCCLFGLKPQPGLRAELNAGTGWSLDAHTDVASQPVPLAADELRQLTLYAPQDLRGREAVRVRLLDGARELATLRVPADAAVRPSYPYAVKPYSTYLEERFHALHGHFTGRSRDELGAWLSTLRKRHWKWLTEHTLGRCPLEPRLVERLEGDICIRDKVLAQTEPGLWMPAFVVYPKQRPAGPLPAIVFTPGSGPGKMDICPDEDENTWQTADDPVNGFEYAGLAHRLARELSCIVLVPDQRGWGEQAETNLPQLGFRAQHSGANYLAQRVWDHVRWLDYLCERDNVDPSRIGCFGGSGGGLATLYTAGIDDRIRAAIVSSSPLTLPHVPDRFFQNMWAAEPADLQPTPERPAASAFTAALTIPRPLWVIDGVRDECVAEPTNPEAGQIWADWHRRSDAARAEIARLYEVAGVAEHFQATWFDGGHCAGMNLNNVSRWFRRWL